MLRAYLGLGSNLQEPVVQLQRAIASLAQLPNSQLVSVSPFYRNPPMGDIVQPPYVNAVAAIDTDLTAWQLLQATQSIEQQQGRNREGPRWGPRTLDIDILLYGENVINEPQLQVPHPGLSQRNFVLYPLYDIAPELVIPGRGSLAYLLKQIPVVGLERLEN